MLSKRTTGLGLLSGLLAAVAALIYQQVYASSLGEGFFTIVTPTAVVAISVISGLVMTVLFTLAQRWLKSKGEAVFNLVLVVLTFASILYPFAKTLPLDIEFPELFPGLLVPMHFFPALAWFTLKPLFGGTSRKPVRPRDYF